jgi:prenyltransferase beta subunit
MSTPSKQMLHAAGAGYGSLNAEAAGKLRAFILSGIDAGGGFKGLDKRPDLYYTVFGIECMLAARMDASQAHIDKFLATYNSDTTTELLSLASLARLICRTGLAYDRQAGTMIERMERFRRDDGGYAGSIDSPSGSVYASFLATLAYTDMEKELPASEKLADFILGRQAAGGGLVNRTSESGPCSTATAAGIVVLDYLGLTTALHADWLQSLACENGGFRFSLKSEAADLISTSTAIHALSGALSGRERRLQHAEFVQSFWHPDGGFCGVPQGDKPDCEHTFYALMALGDLVNG